LSSGEKKEVTHTAKCAEKLGVEWQWFCF